MKLDPTKTAMLTLDFQRGIFDLANGSEAIVPTAARMVELARERHFLLVHVGLAFHEGYPELGDHSPMGERVKPSGRFVHGSTSSEFHPSIVRKGDLVVFKQRVGAFSENELHMILRARGIETLVLFGIATSGITLSTVRRAFDLDYRCVVIEDACWDRDAEVHRVLTQKVLAAQATVMSAADFIVAQA